MTLYLAKRYFINVLVITTVMVILPIAYAESITEAIADSLPFALFWGGLFAAVYTYWDFHRNNLWVLYDNLRLPRIPLLISLFVAVQLLNLSLVMIL